MPRARRAIIDAGRSVSAVSNIVSVIPAPPATRPDAKYRAACSCWRAIASPIGLSVSWIRVRVTREPTTEEAAGGRFRFLWGPPSITHEGSLVERPESPRPIRHVGGYERAYGGAGHAHGCPCPSDRAVHLRRPRVPSLGWPRPWPKLSSKTSRSSSSSPSAATRGRGFSRVATLTGVSP